MITFHRIADGRLERIEGDGPPPVADLLWLDLCDPTPDDERVVETMLGIDVPTRQEMSEIEESARLYHEGEALVMTAAVIDGVAEGRPRRTEVTFVLTRHHLVTVRYANPTPFRTFEARFAKQTAECSTPYMLLVMLIESFVERIADVMEAIAADLDIVSDDIFEDSAGAVGRKTKADLNAVIKVIGRKNRLLSILRQSLLSFGRIIAFLRSASPDRAKGEAGVRLKAIDRDIKSLTTYESQVEQQISFLHEATLGLINIEQSAIIKVFSVAAVLFLPPTLVGTVYGMNFEVMPELGWRFGYPFAIVTMVVSAIIPFWWFKRRGWL